ncbi:helix-turn-helix domain-containing protein [Providencia rettgeri]|uniref:helix-turn-helix domain-containing protein n=1 Tax=Providencia rettgeri TaxID=587 RepID=UPI0009B882F5
MSIIDYSFCIINEESNFELFKEVNNDPESIVLNIASMVRRLRKQRGLSGKELGDMIGLSQQQISRYERGMNNITMDTLCKIANVFGVPVVYLIKNSI